MMIRVLAACAIALGLAGPASAAVEIQEITSPGGIDAWLVEEHSIPFTALEIRFEGGASLDPEGKRGVTNLMTAIIEEGAGDMDAMAFATARDSLAASFRFDVGDDALSVSARFLTENRDEAIDLLREALTNPRFDQPAIDRVRQQVLQNIRSSATDPNDIAGRAFDALAFGDHPYGSDRDGTVESVTPLTRDDIVAAFDAAVARDRVYVAAAGDVTGEELGEILDRLLGDVPETGAPLPGKAEVSLTGGVTIVPFETPQSVALFGHEGIPRDDPDFFAAFVANEIFGGSSRLSRLTEEVREKRGLTYGVGSYLVNYDHADLIIGQVQSANAVMADAIAVIQDEWAKIAAEGVTEEELEAAKTYLTGAYPLRFDGNATIARMLVGMQSIGLTPEYVETRNDNVNAVTLDDVKRVSARLYKPENLRFVVVGQPEGLDPVN